MSTQDKIDKDGIRDDHVPYDPAASRLHIYPDDRQQLANFQTPILLHANNPHERLFVAALDGTGNDKIHDPDYETNVRLISNHIEILKGRSPMLRWFHFPRAVVASAILFLLMTGCHPAMSMQPDNTNEQHSAPNKFPLRFKIHSFAVHCYNTVRCRVIYNNFDFGPDAQPSPPPPSPDYKDHWGLASYTDVRNFPPPAEVSWTSLDGTPHEAKVDIGSIFKDERLLYKVPNTEIREGAYPQGLEEPGIFLEVNDHTINVYMKVMISTKFEQTPGNKDSDYRADLMLAWTHTY